jgi:RND family efflux transporter MFP subunit
MPSIHCRLGYLLILLGSLALAGCEQPSAAEAPRAKISESTAGGPLERVAAGKPQRKTISRTTVQPARVEAFEQTPIYSKITGYAESVLVDIGDRVEKGQPLVRLWVPELRDELAQKEALLAQSKAEVDQARASITAAQAAAETARARVRETEAGVARAEGEYQRWRAESSRIDQLVASGSVTRKLADETLNQFRSSDAARQEVQARVESAKAAFVASQSVIDSAKADVAAAEARVKVAEANLAQAQTMYDYTEIRAPYDGVVTRRFVDTGHYVQPATPNSQPLLTVCHADTVRVFVDVPEMETALVSRGDKALIELQSLAGAEVEGEVTRTGWDLDPANRSLTVEIDVPNKEGRLRPGMYATARILLDEHADVLVLPVTAVVRRGKQAHCCQVVDGKIRHVPIEPGLRSGDELEIASGLTGDETIVLQRADALADGQQVEILPSEPAR